MAKRKRPYLKSKLPYRLDGEKGIIMKYIYSFEIQEIDSLIEHLGKVRITDLSWAEYAEIKRVLRAAQVRLKNAGTRKGDTNFMCLSKNAQQLLFDIYGNTKVQAGHIKFIINCIRSDYDDYTETEQDAADEIIDYIENLEIDFTKEISE